MDLKEYIGAYPNFPKKGILFRDISPLLANPGAFKYTVEQMGQHIDDVDAIAGIDSRGFIFGAALAYAANKPFVMIRKKGKLPGDVKEVSYGLEYGSDVLQIQPVLTGNKKTKVVVVDDLLATGGTTEAAIKLLHDAGYDPVRFLCVIELTELNGRHRVSVPTVSLITYED